MTAQKAKSRKRVLSTVQRDKQLMDMWLAGANWQTISDKLGFGGTGNAYKRWKRLLEEQGPSEQSKEEARQKILMRMDRLLEVVWAKANNSKSPEHLQYWDRAFKQVERTITLHGLDAAKSVQLLLTKQAEELAEKLEGVLGPEEFKRACAVLFGESPSEEVAPREEHPADSDG